MKKIGVFYGSSTGTCEDLAYQIAEKMNIPQSDVYSADKLSNDLIKEYDLLILGTSTWGDGELQDDWYDAVKVMKTADLSFKSIALFGCGDSESYCDTFCDGIGLLYEELKDSNCSFLGNKVSTNGYSYSSSIAVVDGSFVGLALDEVNESNKTAERIATWTTELTSLEE
ncbi:flavodoxin FldA [Bacteroides sp.]|uniref:flavodoxin FldA n=1 Tax=Bacteroides sp. TaxID=29523 RepID=UPI00260D6DD3|nr:flavodoxin FldA [Bacteroides sp.]